MCLSYSCDQRCTASGKLQVMRMATDLGNRANQIEGPQIEGPNQGPNRGTEIEPKSRDPKSRDTLLIYSPAIQMVGFDTKKPTQLFSVRPDVKTPHLPAKRLILEEPLKYIHFIKRISIV